ncbi:MAG TPA: hypothetical protein VHW04_13005 [Solirubrobacteraceae bacterium]|jgi:hypothetical protein|nr:hypothetical protein [Solirubrobacteraceae bacterium]
MRPSLVVVAFAADRPLSPRGERARAIAHAAAGVLPTELIGPPETPGATRRRVRQLARLASPFMLDPWEPEAWLTLRRRRARPLVALLVGFPFSAVYWAARRLVSEDVPYVVDFGDPWALTRATDVPPAMGGGRALRCEEFVWRGASGGILTTQLQADAIRRLFGDVPLLVRPNGYRAVERVAAPCDVRRPRRCLRIVHYGNLYQPRLDIVPVISRLAACGRWDTVVLTQQGEDWTGALRRLPPSVRVELRRPQAWSEVVAAATDHDLALVVGNRNPAQLPSKAIQYLTLPIPRLAVVGPHPADALSAYVRGRPGWLTLRHDAPADLAGAAVAGHLSRPRSTESLAPPADESWGSVAQTVLKFTLARAGERARARPPGPRHAASRAIPAATSSQPR